MPRPASLVVLVALSAGGCALGPNEPPTAPAPARAEAVDRVAAASLDGRDTFALSGRGAARWVSVLETPRATLAVSDDGTLTDVSGAQARPIARDVLPEVRSSSDGRVVAWSVRTTDDVADVQVDVQGSTRRLTEGLAAVVLAVSPDGSQVAFVAPSHGLPALWTVPVAGGAARQLTNVNLPPARGRAPDGFIPPPRRAADASWTGDAIAFDAADGTWRIDARTGEILERP